MWQSLDALILALPAHAALRFLLFMLVLARFSGLMAAAPFFGGESVPPTVKGWVTVLLSLCVVPLLPLPSADVVAWSRQLLGVVLLMTSEFCIGFVFGLAVDLFFAAVQWAGHVLGQQVGFSLADILDPISGTSLSILGQFGYLIAVGVFLCANLHMELVAVIRQSFETLPVGATLQWERVGELLVVGLGSTMWHLGVRLVLPVMLGILLVTVGLAFISRAVPEINVFMMGFGLQALIALWLLYITLPFVVDLYRDGLETMVRDAGGLLTWVRNG
jgi:flagellar biosynthesis protein FliR